MHVFIGPLLLHECTLYRVQGLLHPIDWQWESSPSSAGLWPLEAAWRPLVSPPWPRADKTAGNKCKRYIISSREPKKKKNLRGRDGLLLFFIFFGERQTQSTLHLVLLYYCQPTENSARTLQFSKFGDFFFYYYYYYNIYIIWAKKTQLHTKTSVWRVKITTSFVPSFLRCFRYFFISFAETTNAA